MALSETQSISDSNKINLDDASSRALLRYIKVNNNHFKHVLIFNKNCTNSFFTELSRPFYTLGVWLKFYILNLSLRAKRQPTEFKRSTSKMLITSDCALNLLTNWTPKICDHCRSTRMIGRLYFNLVSKTFFLYNFVEKLKWNYNAPVCASETYANLLARSLYKKSLINRL